MLLLTMAINAKASQHSSLTMGRILASIQYAQRSDTWGERRSTTCRQSLCLQSFHSSSKPPKSAASLSLARRATRSGACVCSLSFREKKFGKKDCESTLKVPPLGVGNQFLRWVGWRGYKVITILKRSAYLCLEDWLGKQFPQPGCSDDLVVLVQCLLDRQELTEGQLDLKDLGCSKLFRGVFCIDQHNSLLLRDDCTVADLVLDTDDFKLPPLDCTASSELRTST